MNKIFAKFTFNPYHWLVAALVAFFVVVPLAFLVMGSLNSALLPMDFSWSTVSIKNYATVYLSPSTYKILWNTLYYVVGSVLFGTFFALLFAWLAERTNLPNKSLVYVGVPLVLAMPGMLEAMAWVLLLSPRIGYINKLLMSAFGLTAAPIDIYTLPGMTILEGLRMVPTGFLMLVPLFRGMDPALEEAAQVCGTGPLTVIKKVTLPLIMPGLMAIAIYKSMTALSGFEIPGIIGLPNGIYVFSTKIYAIVQTAVGIPNYGQASALAMVYLLMAIVGMYIYSKAIRRQEKFSVITGKGYRPRQLDLGRLKYWAFGLAMFYLFVTVILPVLVFAWTSLLPYPAAPSSEALELISNKHWKMIFSYSDIWLTFKNTIFMTFIASTGTVLLAFAVSWIVIRTKFVGRHVLDQLAFIPHGIPGIIFGLAMIWVWLKLQFIPIYGTIWIIALGFIVHFIPYGTRAINAGLLQIHKELEEAAYISGASTKRTFRTVVFPLLAPVFAGVWIWVFLHAVRIVGLPIMLYSGSENQVLAVLLWRMWDDGYMGGVSALGLMILVFMLIVAVIVRRLGFHRRGIQSN